MNPIWELVESVSGRNKYLHQKSTVYTLYIYTMIYIYIICREQTTFHKQRYNDRCRCLSIKMSSALDSMKITTRATPLVYQTTLLWLS